MFFFELKFNFGYTIIEQGDLNDNESYKQNQRRCLSQLQFPWKK
jgi:hypothetical protein